jgi:hypothetical protein
VTRRTDLPDAADLGKGETDFCARLAGHLMIFLHCFPLAFGKSISWPTNLKQGHHRLSQVLIRSLERRPRCRTSATTWPLSGLPFSSTARKIPMSQFSLPALELWARVRKTNMNNPHTWSTGGRGWENLVSAHILCRCINELQTWTRVRFPPPPPFFSGISQRPGVKSLGRGFVCGRTDSGPGRLTTARPRGR